MLFPGWIPVTEGFGYTAEANAVTYSGRWIVPCTAANLQLALAMIDCKERFTAFGTSGASGNYTYKKQIQQTLLSALTAQKMSFKILDTYVENRVNGDGTSVDLNSGINTLENADLAEVSIEWMQQPENTLGLNCCWVSLSGSGDFVEFGESNTVAAKYSAAGIAGGARGAQFTQFKETLAEVRLFARNRAAYDRAGLRDLSLSRADLEALIPVANGTLPLIVTVRRAADIQQVLRLAREEGVKIILDGAEEAWLVADQIAAANVPVLLNPISNLPGSLETRAARMQNAAVLDSAGVVIAIKGNDGSHRVRETRYNAGNAVSHGLPYDAAIEAITVNPAKIFGMAGQFGELRAGAAADVVIWSGDPLEPLSNAETIFIGGAEQAPTSRQFLLRDRYASGGEGALPPAYTR